MNVTVHYPKGKKEMEELRTRVAMIHYSAMLNYIERLPCSLQQKREIMSQIIQKGTD